MTFTETDLRAAAAAGALDTAQLARLLDFLHQRAASLPATTRAPSPQFDVAHLLWYAGALIVMTAMGLFSTLAFSQMGGEALAVTALVYAAGFAAAGHYLWHAKGLRTPGGLLIAIAVSMAPLAVYGVQDALGLWGQFGKPGTVQGFYVWIKGSWIFMEVAAILAAAIALRFYPFPFIVVIAGVALWFMSMDLAPWVAGTDHADWRAQAGLALVRAWHARHCLGRRLAAARRLCLLAAPVRHARLLGRRHVHLRRDHGRRPLYCAMNVVLLFLRCSSAAKVYAVFGVIGIALYGDLANKVFRDSLLFRSHCRDRRRSDRGRPALLSPSGGDRGVAANMPDALRRAGARRLIQLNASGRLISISTKAIG